MSSRTIVIAGAGIGGLTAAIAIAEKGYRVVVYDKSDKLEETGAGIQLSPNATRVLIALGFADQLAATAMAAEEIRIRTPRDRTIVRIPLGRAAITWFGSPYYVIHRADLQAMLLDAARAHHDIFVELGCEVDNFVSHVNGLTVQFRRRQRLEETYAIALVGADGLWSSMRTKFAGEKLPRFVKRTAWRTLLKPAAVDPEYREAAVTLWLGRNTHLVVYPVKQGAAINMVAVASGTQQTSGWSTPAGSDEVAPRFSRWSWSEDIRYMMGEADRWLKWQLYDRPPLANWGRGAVTLLGDAAHPMLPFLAQGAAMAIEDAGVIAACIAKTPGDLAGAFRSYEALRQPRTAKVQRAARRNDLVYHLAWPESGMRNLALRAMGGKGLLDRYDWIYNWRPDL